MDIKEEIGNIIFEYCRKETPYNDEITRTEISNLIRDKLFGSTTITEYKIKCDKDNNSIDLIENNGFCLDLSIKENGVWRNINYTIESTILDVNEINEQI